MRGSVLSTMVTQTQTQTSEQKHAVKGGLKFWRNTAALTFIEAERILFPLGDQFVTSRNSLRGCFEPPVVMSVGGPMKVIAPSVWSV